LQQEADLCSFFEAKKYLSFAFKDDYIAKRAEKKTTRKLNRACPVFNDNNNL